MEMISRELARSRSVAASRRRKAGVHTSRAPTAGYLSHHLAAISMAAVYMDALHIAYGVVGLKQRSLAASDPTA